MFKIKCDYVAVIVAVFIAIVVVGEVSLYGPTYYHCSASIERNGEYADYSFDTNINMSYGVVSLDNSSNTTTGVVAFYDEDVKSANYRPDVKTSLDYLKSYLAKDSIDMGYVDQDELTNLIINEDTSVAIIFATGVLPYTVYTGSSSDPIFTWLAAGGTMYWLGDTIGGTYYDSDIIRHKVEDPDSLFFNNTDVVRVHVQNEGSIYDDTYVEGSIGQITRQYYNECTYGLDVSRLTTSYQMLDYNHEGYHSVVFLKYHSGTGKICVFGGGLNKYSVGGDTAQVVSQTIASRIVYDSVVIDHCFGKNAKNASGSVRVSASPTDVFVFSTTTDVIYGKNVTV